MNISERLKKFEEEWDYFWKAGEKVGKEMSPQAQEAGWAEIEIIERIAAELKVCPRRLVEAFWGGFDSVKKKENAKKEENNEG